MAKFLQFTSVILFLLIASAGNAQSIKYLNDSELYDLKTQNKLSGEPTYKGIFVEYEILTNDITLDEAELNNLKAALEKNSQVVYNAFSSSDKKLVVRVSCHKDCMPIDKIKEAVVPSGLQINGLKEHYFINK